MPDRWCTVTVTDAEGRRHSLDVLASSTCDASHLYVTHAKAHANSLPVPTLSMVLEVAIDGRVHCVRGTALQQWILQRRQAWKGPKGLLFSRPPTLD